MRSVEALVSLGDRYLGKAPVFEVDIPWWNEIESVTTPLEALLGTPVVVLRLVHADEHEIGRGGRVVYHVQAAGEPRPGVLDPTPSPDWSAVIKPHPLRATWAEVDGPQRLIDWATSHLGPLTPTQVKTWNLSCLIRFPGAWAKATCRFCTVDGAVIRRVHQYDAALAPTVLAVDHERGWSLLAHAPGIDCWQPDRATVEDVVTRWVAVQAGLAGEELEDVPRMLPRDLPAELDGLLAGEAGRKLSATELTQARMLMDELPEVIAELESAGLPNTLVHGDFHPGNWRSDGTNRLIVDWADSYLGHPATDIERLRGWLPVEKQDHAVSIWLDAWRSCLPDSRPERALRPITVIARLLGALTYQRFLDNIEPDERVYHEDDPASEIRAAIAAQS
ncbi:phosphotransferase family enzyme [Kribbella sp. VKM Ac-2527]|uniref:Phosphotransferase family enzyme n=1 Tax=Kribbella caucasensis TaxID=2512215 RepID=A0A4R6KB40_9ACTN|nr:aminoglycoside phosphotransferase family protein [Kribbella sp. VKM Ac-2527]TDO46321.1 phosphotransferase family enzyme [Kribbella sp. VKM Ac-2527]